MKKNVSSTLKRSDTDFSLLLANIYLHVFDMYWNTQKDNPGKLIRYADDCIILCYRKSEASKALCMIERFMGNFKLTLHPRKTCLVDLNVSGFDFLGYHFAKRASKITGKVVPYNWPSSQSMKAIRGKIRDVTTRSMFRLTKDMMVSKLNPIIRGWRNYFKYGNSTNQFQTMDRYVKYRLYRFLKRRGGNRCNVTWKAYCAWYENFCSLEKFFTQGILVYNTS